MSFFLNVQHISLFASSFLWFCNLFHNLKDDVRKEYVAINIETTGLIANFKYQRTNSDTNMFIIGIGIRVYVSVEIIQYITMCDALSCIHIHK